MIMGMQNMQNLEGFGKLIFFFLLLFLAWKKEGLLRNIRDLNIVTCHTKEEGEFSYVRISRLEQKSYFLNV